MLNIASVNMPKIQKPKLLIIKTLKSKSPAEVADIFNVSKRQVERIRKRYQETGDVHDRPHKTDRPRQTAQDRPRKTTAGDESLLVRLTAPEEWTPATPVLSRTVRRILARNGLHGCIFTQKQR